MLDVTVEHAVYGQLSGQLHICSRYDVSSFMSQLKKSNSVPLSDLTGGIHLHRVAFHNEEDMQRTLTVLKQKGYLLEQR